MSKSDYMLVSKRDIECMARLIIRLINKSFAVSELGKLEDSIDNDVFEVIAKTFRESGI